MDIPMKLVGDPNRIRQIISNIAQNAVKFTPAGGNVQIEASLSVEGIRTQRNIENQSNRRRNEIYDEKFDRKDENTSKAVVLRVEVHVVHD